MRRHECWEITDDHAEVGKGQPELVVNCACQIGENPLWDVASQKLYWVDIPAGRLFRYAPRSKQRAQVDIGCPVGGFTLQSGGGLLLFMDRGTIGRWSDEGGLQVCLSEIPAERASRFNDVIADPEGRVFCGTMATPGAGGRLYRLDTDGSLHLLLENIGCSNGMAFAGDFRSFYYTDSFAREIYRFAYNRSDGSISDRQVFAGFSEQDGLPDGLTIDDQDHLWTALWDGGRIMRLAPDARIVEC